MNNLSGARTHKRARTVTGQPEYKGYIFSFMIGFPELDTENRDIIMTKSILRENGNSSPDIHPQPMKNDVDCLMCCCVNIVFPFEMCFANLITEINIFLLYHI